jgi:hypothetical protein
VVVLKTQTPARAQTDQSRAHKTDSEAGLRVLSLSLVSPKLLSLARRRPKAHTLAGLGRIIGIGVIRRSCALRLPFLCARPANN